MKASEINKDNYKEYLKDPVLVYNAIQYLGGNFYRALLGCGTIANTALDERLARYLDRYYYSLYETDGYELAAYYTDKEISLRGLLWYDNTIPPKYEKTNKKNFFIGRNSVFYLRRVECDKESPYVDVEFITKVSRDYKIIRSHITETGRFWEHCEKLSEKEVYDFKRNS